MNPDIAISGNSIAVGRTARYYTAGRPDSADALWYCLHGYGQQAADFAGEVAAVTTPHRSIIAPEALSRFYQSGTDGSVGASWMTREDRANEIADYVAYLNALRSQIIRSRIGTDAPVEVVLGFSQGTATASRWIANLEPEGEIRALVLWGGTVASDINEAGLERIRRVKRRVLVFGDNDRYADEDRISKEKRLLNERELQFELIRFRGGHRIDLPTLNSIAADID